MEADPGKEFEVIGIHDFCSLFLFLFPTKQLLTRYRFILELCYDHTSVKIDKLGGIFFIFFAANEFSSCQMNRLVVVL